MTISERHILSLLEVPRLGRRTVWQVLSCVGGKIEHTSDLAQAIADARRESNRIPKPSQAELDQAVDTADQILVRSQKLGLRVIGIGNSGYPRRLEGIPDPPLVLFVKGNVDALNNPLAAAVIGTREPSSWGGGAGERLAQRLAERGVTVVSGLALGCDTVAHRGCLLGCGTTVAVLAHGLHTIYPAANRDLANEIVATGGCLVSEYAPDVRAQRSYFVERDRLQSGLSNGVLVIETDIDGGTMHTVKAAIAQSRVLACLAHPRKFSNKKSRGNEMLISRGEAMPVGGTEDIEEFIRRMSTLSSGPSLESDSRHDNPGLFDDSAGVGKWP